MRKWDKGLKIDQKGKLRELIKNIIKEKGRERKNGRKSGRG